MVITVKNEDQLCCTRSKVDCHPDCEDSETGVVSKPSRSWCLLAWQESVLVVTKLQAFPQIVYQLVLVDVTRGCLVASFSLLTTSTDIVLLNDNGRYDTRAEKTNCLKVSISADLTTT